jgi:hypothetical protein
MVEVGGLRSGVISRLKLESSIPIHPQHNTSIYHHANIFHSKKESYWTLKLDIDICILIDVALGKYFWYIWVVQTSELFWLHCDFLYSISHHDMSAHSLRLINDFQCYKNCLLVVRLYLVITAISVILAFWMA